MDIPRSPTQAGTGHNGRMEPRHGVDPDPDTWPTGRLLSAAARRMEQAWNAHLAGWHLTHASLPALAFLRRGPLSQRELATALGVTEQTTSRIVAGLERHGYVERRPDPADARRHELLITTSGAHALEALDDGGASADAAVGQRLTPAEEADLRALLRKFL